MSSESRRERDGRGAVVEIAKLQIVPGQEADFEQAFARARRLLDGARGHLGHALHRCLEDPACYWLFITWQTLEDHTVAFRASPQHDIWKQMLAPFYSARPEVVHTVQT